MLGLSLSSWWPYASSHLLDMTRNSSSSTQLMSLGEQTMESPGVLGFSLAVMSLLVCVFPSSSSPSPPFFFFFFWAKELLKLCSSGYDGAIHLSEEMKNPRVGIPIAMIGFLVAILFNMGDLGVCPENYDWLSHYLIFSIALPATSIQPLLSCPTWHQSHF